MANVLTEGRIYRLDSLGVLTTKPICVDRIILFPNAAADSATFVSWNPTGTAVATQGDKTVTVTSASILTSTGNFETSEVSSLDIIKIMQTSTGNNIGTYLVLTRDTDHQITTTGATLTNDTGATYSWKTFSPTVECIITAEGTTNVKLPVEINFGGRWFPNLALQARSTSAVTHVYIK